MVPTEAGELLLAGLPPVLDELARLRDEAASLRTGPVGTLRLTTSVAFGQVVLLPHLGAFRAAFPRLRLDLLLTDRNLDLVTDRVDLAIRLAPSHRADVAGQRLMPTRYCVVASPAWVSRQGAPQAPGNLGGHDCLLFDLPDYRTRWMFRNEQGQIDVPVRGSVVISSPLALRQAALDGLGPALLADWLVVQDLAAGRLVNLFPSHEVTATAFDTAAWLLYPSREHLPRKTRSAIAFLRTRLGATAAP
jgi:DNA-binding transcriptional LysR family regulator